MHYNDHCSRTSNAIKFAGFMFFPIQNRGDKIKRMLALHTLINQEERYLAMYGKVNQ